MRVGGCGGEAVPVQRGGEGEGVVERVGGGEGEEGRGRRRELPRPGTSRLVVVLQQAGAGQAVTRLGGGVRHGGHV